jgi:DNA-binding NtrC family response regulator
MADRGRILVVDDNAANVEVLRMRLAAEGHEVLEALDGPTALEIVEREQPDLVLLDIIMPGMDGYEVCRRIKAGQQADFIPVIMVTAKTETEAVVKGLREGADEYITKPFQPLELSARVHSMLRIRRMHQETTSLRREISRGQRTDQLLGRSPALARVLAQLSEVAGTDVPVFITGATGTGKGLAARSVHDTSPRQAGPFIQVNCGAIPENLVESELFGHERGAFTGAVARRLGKAELADTGTLFLDEIGDLPLTAQAKLLRFLDDQSFERVGGTETKTPDVRIMAATNRDLQLMVADGSFREDLYFRLRVFPVRLPPLCERREDVPLLATYFVERMAAHLNKKVTRLAPEVLAALQAYGWPGNVRELEHTMQRAVIVCRGETIQTRDITLGMEERVEARADGPTEELVTLETVERRYICRVLEHTRWIIGGPHGAAAILGLNESTLRGRFRKLNIRRP